MEYSDKIYSQSPKFKLSNNLGLESYQDSDSNKYNQNKNRGKAYCQHYLDSSG